MAGQLTALGIGQLKRPGKYYDGTHGLFLQAYPSGAKCWQQRLTIAGRRRTLGLGGYPAVGLANVRAAACKNWLLVRDGGDPFAKPPKAAPTFEEAAAAVIEQNAPTWTDPKHPKDWQNSLRRYAFPCLGQLLVSHIEIHHVLEALQPIWHTRRETARHVRQRIRAILDWAVTQGYRTDNPAGPAIHGVLPKRRSREHEKRHHPAVPYSELPQVIAATRGLTSRVPLRLVLEFVVLTAVRSGDGREAQWSEFDFATATWLIPATRMKTGFPHRVPLSDRVDDQDRAEQPHIRIAVDPQPPESEEVVGIVNFVAVAQHRVDAVRARLERGARGASGTAVHVGPPPESAIAAPTLAALSTVSIAASVMP